MTGKHGPGRVAALLVAALTILWCAPALPAEPDLRSLVEAAKAADADGPAIARMTLVDATSKHLKRIEGDIDFPFQIGLDLPIDAEPRDLGAALKRPVSETGRYVIVFDVALAKVTRRVRDTKDQVSQKVTSLAKIENPAFVRAVRAYDKASVRFEKRPNDARLVKALEDARAKMTTTPQHLEKATLGAYTYKLADIEGSKAMTVNYYLVDRVAGRYVKSVFDLVERERFRLAYDVDATDPASRLVVTEDHVRSWERAPAMINLSDLLNHALSQGGPNRPDADLAALLDEVSRDRNRAIARAEAENYDDRPLNDPRFDSVVAIYTGQGSMGSGFFVRSNIVMTNWHVVERQPIVELRLYDKRETFGQVIAKDVLLDLALVKVQDRGRVASFHQGKELSPGEGVDAIGHPKRRMFSITRGVVSSVRKLSSHTLGGREVLYVQTDADINPGNSGGPLFKGDKVVGINTWGASHRHVDSAGNSVDVPVPGLNFAVHYAEAKRFLDEAMKGE